MESEPRMSLLGSRAPDALTMCRRFLERRVRRSGSGRLRVLAEVDFGADPADWREGQRFESVYNRLMGEAPGVGDLPLRQRRLPAAGDRRAQPPPIRCWSAAREWTSTPRSRTRAPTSRRCRCPAQPVEDGDPVFVVENAPTPARSAAPARRRARRRCVADRDQQEDLHLAVSRDRGQRLPARRPAGRPPGCGPTATAIVCVDLRPGHLLRRPVLRVPARPTASTCPTAAWACGWPASSGTTSTCCPTATGLQPSG